MIIVKATGQLYIPVKYFQNHSHFLFSVYHNSESRLDLIDNNQSARLCLNFLSGVDVCVKGYCSR